MRSRTTRIGQRLTYWRVRPNRWGKHIVPKSVTIDKLGIDTRDFSEGLKAVARALRG